jgi:hypothetical protein
MCVGKVVVKLHALLTSALDGDERLVSHSSHFTLGDSRWMRGRLGPTARLATVAKRSQIHFRLIHILAACNIQNYTVFNTLFSCVA